MDERIILIIITLLFFGCVSDRIYIDSVHSVPQPQFLNTNEPPKQIIIKTNDAEYWGILYPEPANRILKIIKNAEIYSNIRASNEVIISNQDNIIANKDKVIKKTNRQKRRNAWKWFGIVSGASVLSLLLGMIIQAIKGFLA